MKFHSDSVNDALYKNTIDFGLEMLLTTVVLLSILIAYTAYHHRFRNRL